MSGARRILFVELLGGLGDVAIALPAIQALARSHPGAALDVLTFAPGAGLLAHDPHVAAVHVAPKGGARGAVEALLAREGYDLAVSTTDYDGIGALIRARVPRAVTDLWRDPPDDEIVERRFTEILTAEGLVAPGAAGPAHLFLTAEERARAAARLPEGDRAALLIDAGMAIKRWPEARFAALGARLRDGHGLRPLVIGGADPGAAARVAAMIGPGAEALEPLPLRDLAALLGRCALAVGADTGPLRVAALAGAPSAMLFGPSWAGRYGLGAGHSNVQALPGCPERRTDFTAQRCWYSGACPLPRGPEGCAAEIGAEAAEAEAARLLAARRPAPAAARDWAADWSADWARARRLLVLRLDNIGDVLMTGPALRALRLSRPEAHVTLMASPSGAQAAPLLPWIDGTIAERTLWQDLGSLPFDPAREAAFVGRLAAGAWDGAIVLTSFSQSPHPAALACRRAGIPLVAGASDETGAALTHLVPKGDRTMHQAARNLALARALGFAAGGEAMEIAVPPAARAAARRLAGGGAYLLLSPWASAAARQYDPARMAEATTTIAARHGLRVVVTGAPGDAARGAAMARAIPGALDFTGRTSVPEAAALVEGARLALCCNSSAMHMAEALRVPAVILFAGTELPSQWAPRHGPHRLLAHPVPCAPCHAFECPLGHHACLDVPPEDVAAAADALLSQTRMEAAS